MRNFYVFRLLLRKSVAKGLKAVFHSTQQELGETKADCFLMHFIKLHQEETYFGSCFVPKDTLAVKRLIS